MSTKRKLDGHYLKRLLAGELMADPVVRRGVEAGPSPSGALHAAGGAPVADLVGVLAVVVGGVVVDDAVRRLAGPPALGGDAVGGLHEVFVRARAPSRDASR